MMNFHHLLHLTAHACFAMSEPARIPRLGERTAEFQHGYGRCQCGCGGLVEALDTAGRYRRFIADHDAIAVRRRAVTADAPASPETRRQHPQGATHDRRAATAMEAEAPDDLAGSDILVGRYTSRRANELGRRETDRLVDLFADQTLALQQLQVKLGILQSEVEFAIRYVKAFCHDDHRIGDALVSRLEAALQSVRQEKGAD